MRHFPRKVDITDQKKMKERMQELVDFACNPATLGKGRDQVISEKYSRLLVTRVWGIENPGLWRKYAAARLGIRGDLYGSKRTDHHVRTNCDSAWMESELDRDVKARPRAERQGEKCAQGAFGTWPRLRATV
jgi:hypothetical protein